MTDINKIYVNSNIIIQNGYSNSLCFVDGYAIDKSKYAIENNEISILKDGKDYLSVFYNTNCSQCYYYKKILNDYGVVVYGVDEQSKTMQGLKNGNILVFLDGVLLSENEYEILDEENIALLIVKSDTKMHQIIIYVSNSPLIHGVLHDPTNTQETSDYRRKRNPENKINYNRFDTLIFRNGIFLSPLQTQTINGYTEVTFKPEDSDNFEYYKINDGTISFNFQAELGITEFGPIDDFQTNIPLLYDTIVVFDDLVKVVVDDLRPGFIISEKNNPGKLLVVDTNYESNKLKTITLSPFYKTNYTKDDYYLEIPEAKNIVGYLSDYDKKYTMIPEILRIFQRVLLDEIHDEIERIKNIRNVSRVNSDDIYKLIRLLGLNLDIKHLNIKQMQEALDELTNFYRIAGTKNSLNYFNIVQDNTKLISVKQLFTFHKKKKKQEKNQIWSYVYPQAPSDNLQSGAGYSVNEKYSLKGQDNKDIGIIVTIKEVNQYGSILKYSASKYEGPYLDNEFYTLDTISKGAIANLTSTPYIYRYQNSGLQLTSTDDRFYQQQELTTPLFEGKIIVDQVNNDDSDIGPGVITKYHITPETGTISYNDIKDIPVTADTSSNLQLKIKPTVDSLEKIYEYYDGGYIEIPIDVTGEYKITMSGAGGSGGAADSTKNYGQGIGETADLPAENGYKGELVTTIIKCNAGTKITANLGYGGNSSYARGGGPVTAGVGGAGDTNGKDGEGTERVSEYDYWYISSGRYAQKPKHYCRAASGAGGGGSSFTYMGTPYRAKGGDGGSASDGVTKKLGGIGGNGGTKSGTGADGGLRNQNDDSFRSHAGKNGYIIIERIKRNFSDNSSLINNSGLYVAPNDTYKTDDNSFELTVNSVAGGKITGYTINPTTGYVPIEEKVYKLIPTKSSPSAILTINSTIDTYNYNVTIDNSPNLYLEGQILEAPIDSEHSMTITVNNTNNGVITNFSYIINGVNVSNNTGPYLYNINNIPLTTRTGANAKIRIKSTQHSQAAQSIEREYVDFYLPEEQGAILHKDYIFPTTDYGYVAQGSPGSPWPWTPGIPDIEYGSVNEGSPNSPLPSQPGNPDIDYGYVKDKIRGKWVEWLEWDRPDGLYPTNHVEVEINILSVENYEEAIARFYKQFYSLASTVLYIHRLITTYNFGNNDTASISEANPYADNGKILMGFMTTQPFAENIVCLTSDPNYPLPKNIEIPRSDSIVFDRTTDQYDGTTGMVTFGNDTPYVVISDNDGNIVLDYAN